MKTIAIDFETFTSPGYSLRGGFDPYLADSRFRVLSVAAHGGAGPFYAGPPETCPWGELLDADLLVAHHAGFERAVLRKIGRDPGPVNKWRDTADLAAYLQAPRKLKECSPILLPDLPVKIEIHLDGRETADAELLEYNAHDAKLSWEIWNRHGKHWPDAEIEISAATLEMAERGVLLDLERARQYHAQARAIQEEVATRVPWTPKYKPASHKGVDEACAALNIPTPPKKKDGEEEFEAWVSTYGPVAPWITELSRFRSASALAGRIEKLIKRRRADGRVRADLFYYGAWTGRWTSSGGINFQNQRRKPFEGIDARSLIIPAPDFKLLVSDLSQIEPRVLNWLAGNKPFLDLIAGGRDPYQATAIQLGLWDGQGALAEETRQLCKGAALSLGYGVGGERFSGITGIDLQASYDFVDKWRAANPEITALWARLEQAMRKNIGGHWALRLPSGRYLRFGHITEDPGGELKAVINRGGPPESFWGSKIAQAMTQAVARDVFAHGLLRARKLRGVGVLFTSHDEIVTEVPSSEARELELQLTAAMNTAPPWAPDLPLGSKAHILACYTKL